MKFIKKTLAVMLAGSFILASCNVDDVEELNTSPEVPPLATMLMDFSNFDENGNDGGRTAAQGNWAFSALNAGVWNVIIATTMAIPVASFKAAISQKGSFDVDRQLWAWRYDYQHVGRTYTSELTGKIDGNTVVWEMYISQENGFQNVLWFKGVSNTDGKSGSWTLNKDVNNPREALQIDWVRENDEIGSIRYTNVATDDKGKGGFIQYGRKTGSDFDTFYTISLVSLDNEILIEWNKENKNGRVKNSDHFKDADWHCWNTEFKDVDC